MIMQKRIKSDVKTHIKINKLREIKNLIEINRNIYQDFFVDEWKKIDFILKKLTLAEQNEMQYFICELIEKSEIIAYKLASEVEKNQIDFDFILKNFNNENYYI